MEKVNMSQLINETAEELNIPYENAREVIQLTFIPIILKHMTANRQVNIATIGVLYPAQARRPKEDGTYRITPKLRASPVAKRILSREERNS